VRVALGIACAIVISWVLSTGIVAWMLTHRHAAIAPERFALPAGASQERLVAKDGIELGAWVTRTDQPDRPCALLVHGNGGSRSDMIAIYQRLVSDGFCVMAITVRAHGDSGGETNDFGYSAAADVEAGVAFLEKVAADRQIIVMGRSLGAAAAIYSAKGLGERVDGYFLEQPYKDIDSATLNRVHMFAGNYLGAAGYGSLLLWAKLLIDVPIEELSPAVHARDIPPKIPVVIITGTADRHATLEDVRAVYESVRSHGLLIEVHGATHVPLDGYAPVQFYTAVTALQGMMAERE